MLQIAGKRFEIRTGLLGDSVFLIGGSATSALGGFLFWLLAARRTSPASIGLASALIASSMILTGLSDMGLSVSLVRYSSLTTNHQNLVNTAIRLAIILGSFAVMAFLIGLPLWSPALIEVRQNITLMIVFYLFTVANQVIGYQDMVMLSTGKPEFIFWRNVACNVPTSLFLVALAPLAKVGTVVAYTFMLPNLIVVIYTSLITLPKSMPEYRFCGTFDAIIVHGIWRYGFTNYLGNLLWALPSYLLPILAVSINSLEGGGVFAIAWTLTGVIFIIPRTVSMALFKRLSKTGSFDWRALIVSSIIVFILGLPGILFLWTIGPWVLSLFGNSYVDTVLLGKMLLSFIPFSINTLLFSLLRISRQVWWIIVFSACYAFTIITTLLAMSDGSIQSVATGWLVGSAIAVLPCSIIAILSRRYNRDPL